MPLKIKAYIARIERQILKNKVNARKSLLRSSVYKDNPRVTFIIQLFNQRRNIKRIINSLRAINADEIIVIDDGSVDGSYHELLKLLDKPNDFLLRSNDLYEVRMYDRAMRMAKGNIVCLLQDDDIPPANREWLDSAIYLFNIFPKLLILGGRDGHEIMLPDSGKLNKSDYYRLTKDLDIWVSNDIWQCPGIYKFRLQQSPQRKEPSADIPFMFTMAVNRAPTFLRREEFIKIGGINQSFAPYQNDDIEYCLRAWLSGYQVGLYSSSFARNVSFSGMSLFNLDHDSDCGKNNWSKIYSSYFDEISSGFLDRLVKVTNNDLDTIE